MENEKIVTAPAEESAAEQPNPVLNTLKKAGSKVVNTFSNCEVWLYIFTIITASLLIIFIGMLIMGIGKAVGQTIEYNSALEVAEQSAYENNNYTFEITGKHVSEGHFFFTYSFTYVFNEELYTDERDVEVSENIFDSAEIGNMINVQTLEVTEQVNSEDHSSISVYY